MLQHGRPGLWKVIHVVPVLLYICHDLVNPDVFELLFVITDSLILFIPRLNGVLAQNFRVDAVEATMASFDVDHFLFQEAVVEVLYPLVASLTIVRF